MTFPFTVHDWYWNVGDDVANVWSSKRAKSVPVTDEEYVLWHDGRGPTPAANMNELRAYLRVHFPPGTLETYAAYVRNETSGGGIVVNGRPFATDPLTLGSLNSAYIYTQANASTTFSWKLPDGTFVTLGKQDIAQLQAAVSQWGQTCFDCEADTLDAIEAGTITTHAEIDAAFAALNNSVSGLKLQTRKKK